MKDKKLEKEFGEYFEGVNISDDITRDAKNCVRPKRSAMPKFLKFASVAASFVIVFAVALTVIIKSNRREQAPAPSAAYYTDADLDTKSASAYSLSSLDPSLKLIQNFALASNASVSSCDTGYMDGKLALVKAEVDLYYGLYRDETLIFVEFTDGASHEALKEYRDGEKRLWRGTEYYLLKRVAENGEPEFMLHVNYNEVKYYLRVRSSDAAAYEKYLKMIIE